MKPNGHKHACLVAKGFSQVEGVDFYKIFSPVVRFETVQLMLALATLENWHIESLDVHSAYLYGKLTKEIYMKQPEGFRVPGQEHKVLHLLRALYVLRFTFFFAFLISICPTLLANAFPSHNDYYSLPLLSRWSS